MALGSILRPALNASRVFGLGPPDSYRSRPLAAGTSENSIRPSRWRNT